MWMLIYFKSPQQSEQILFSDLHKLCQFVTDKKIKEFSTKWYESSNV